METRTAAVPEDRTPTPLEPDTLVPAQYFARVGTDVAFQPEKRLMLAVLEEAVATFQRHVSLDAPRSKRLVAEVEEWTTGGDGQWPFSFENICAALGIEPEYLRAGLNRWKDHESGRGRKGEAGVYRFPFRRVNGRRHSISGPREYRKSA